MITIVEDLITKDTNLVELNEQEYDKKELARTLNIDKKTLESWNNWYNVDGKWYYFKSSMHPYCFFNELMGVELAKYFNLDTVEYKIAYNKLNINRNNPFYNDYPLYNYGLASENFREKDKEYLNSEALGWLNFKNLSIIDLLRCDTEENYNELIRNIIKLTVLDFYMQQEDRCNGNIFFSKDKENYIRLAKVFDFEAAFAKLTLEYRNELLLLDLENKDTLEIVRTNYDFQEQFYNLMHIDMQDVIERIHDKYKLKIVRDFVDLYYTHDNMIKKLIKEYQII